MVSIGRSVGKHLHNKPLLIHDNFYESEVFHWVVGHTIFEEKPVQVSYKTGSPVSILFNEPSILFEETRSQES